MQSFKAAQENKIKYRKLSTGIIKRYGSQDFKAPVPTYIPKCPTDLLNSRLKNAPITTSNQLTDLPVAKYSSLHVQRHSCEWF